MSARLTRLSRGLRNSSTLAAEVRNVRSTSSTSATCSTRACFRDAFPGHATPPLEARLRYGVAGECAEPVEPPQTGFGGSDWRAVGVLSTVSRTSHSHHCLPAKWVSGRSQQKWISVDFGRAVPKNSAPAAMGGHFRWLPADPTPTRGVRARQ